MTDLMEEAILKERRRLEQEQHETIIALMLGREAPESKQLCAAQPASSGTAPALETRPAEEVERVYELNVLGAPDEIYDVFSCRSYLQSDLVELLEKLRAAEAASTEVATLTLVEAIQAIELWLSGLRLVTGLAHAEASSGSFH